MINGLEGIPRSGKSYEATVFHVLVYLQQGYQVITNLPLDVEKFAVINPEFRKLIVKRTRAQPIRGTWDMNRVDENGNGNAFELFEDGHVEDPGPQVPVFGHVWDFYSTWKHPVTKLGPKFIIDECHNSLPKLGTPTTLIEWFKLHGHFNVDVLLMTQNFRDICQQIAGLMGMLVKVRKADILGRADHYIRKVHGGYRGAVISTEERKYQPQYFGLYKSHTQGNSVAESLATDVKPMSVKLKRFTIAVWIVGISLCVYTFWPSTKPAPKHDAKSQEWLQTLPRGPDAQVTYPAPSERPSEPLSMPIEPSGSKAATEAQQVDVDPEPFKGKGLHLVGSMQLGQRLVYRFVVSDGGKRIFDLFDADLRDAGYAFKPLTHCAGMLTYGKVVRPVVCDAPAQVPGSSSAPIVMEAGSKARSDDHLTGRRVGEHINF